MKKGEWKLAKMKECELPEKVAAGFNEAMTNVFGIECTPVMYCGRQVVHGINHMIICKVVFDNVAKDEVLASVILHEETDSRTKSKYSILSINNICG